MKPQIIMRRRALEKHERSAGSPFSSVVHDCMSCERMVNVRQTTNQKCTVSHISCDVVCLFVPSDCVYLVLLVLGEGKKQRQLDHDDRKKQQSSEGKTQPDIKPSHGGLFCFFKRENCHFEKRKKKRKYVFLSHSSSFNPLNSSSLPVSSCFYFR